MRDDVHHCTCNMINNMCPCGLSKGDEVIILGDSAEFAHGLKAGERDVLVHHEHWGNGSGWRMKSGWDVSCQDIELANPPVTDDEVNEAIASILKENCGHHQDQEV